MTASVRRRLARPASTAAETLDSLPVAVLTVDREGRCTSMNRCALDLFAGRLPGEAMLSDLFAGWFGPPGLPQPWCEPARDPPAPAWRVTATDGRVFWLAPRRLGEGDTSLTIIEAGGPAQAVEAEGPDPVTGLIRRDALLARIDEAIARAPPGEPGLTVFYVDLDRFKGVNDTLGHATGDLLLRKVGERLHSAAPAGSLVARLDADEFVVASLGEGACSGLDALAARLVDLVGRSYVIGSNILNIGASVGLAVFPNDGRDGETLVHNANVALRCAKAGGGGAFRFFEPAMTEALRARRSLEIDLRRALALKQFELAYQPQVRLDTEEIVGFEALLRWRNPQRGMVSPAEFIPLAEELNLIGPIGEWALRTACRVAASWIRPVSVAVNLSPLQFRGGKLTAVVTSALARSGLDPRRLELEITEGALLDNTNLVVETLRELRGLGIRVAMDDFGTGYSSLSYLQKFPFDKIKIDQSFIRQMDRNPEAQAIVRAVVHLGESLGIHTIAEGVETTEQLNRVRAEGCRQVQGYLTGKPMPAEAVELLLKGQKSSSQGEVR